MNTPPSHLSFALHTITGLQSSLSSPTSRPTITVAVPTYGYGNTLGLNGELHGKFAAGLTENSAAISLQIIEMMTLTSAMLVLMIQAAKRKKYFVKSTSTELVTSRRDLERVIMRADSL